MLMFISLGAVWMLGEIKFKECLTEEALKQVPNDRRLSGVLNIGITDLIKAVEKEDKEMDNLCICQDQSPPPRTGDTASIGIAVL